MPPPKRKSVGNDADAGSTSEELKSLRKKVKSDEFMSVSTDTDTEVVTKKKKKKKVSGANINVFDASGSAGDAIKFLKEITSKMANCVFAEENGLAQGAKSVLGLCSEYEVLVMSLVAENERLRGRLESVSLRPSLNGGTASLTDAGRMPPPSTPLVSKVRETYSAIVRSKDAAASPEELVKTVMKEVAPTLGVRVHEVKPVKAGGVLIRTPSRAETQKVVENKKMKELGLTVQLNQKLGPRVVIQGVPSEISTDEFMSELFEKNLEEKLSLEEFRKGVKVVSRPWKAEDDVVVNVVLEGPGAAMDHLLEAGRCYIKWYAFRVRPCNLMPGCFRCMGFDHRVAECKAKQEVCRRCGQSGHKASQCGNALHCRNCAFKGKEAGHGMMSSSCPVYAAIVARALARH